MIYNIRILDNLCTRYEICFAWQPHIFKFHLLYKLDHCPQKLLMKLPFIWAGHLYVKSDVYGFGVVLLEIITGLRVLDTNRPSSQHNLVDWAKPQLPDKRKLRKLIDPRLNQDYPSKGVGKVSELILSCLELDPKHRPSMEEVLASLEHISSIKAKPKESKVKPSQVHGPHRDRRHQSAHQSPLHMKQGRGGRAEQRSPIRSYWLKRSMSFICGKQKWNIQDQFAKEAQWRGPIRDCMLAQELWKVKCVWLCICNCRNKLYVKLLVHSIQYIGRVFL